MNLSRRLLLRLGAGAGATGGGAFIARAGPRLPLPPLAPHFDYPLPPIPPAGAAAAHAPDPPPYVMLDPGHGGRDPGTIGVGGVMEKTIALAVGFALRRALLGSGRYRVGMTRTRDVFVTLTDRVAMTVRAHADLFISLHCNHFANPNLRGAMIFTLSHNASDRMAGEIASAENSYDQGPINPALRGVSREVAAILGSLQMKATDLASKRIASDIVEEFQSSIALLPEPDRSANFAVLRDPVVPATLIEMACLSNREDERLLRSPAFRALLASRIAGAVDRYFSRQHPMRVAG